MRDMDSLQLSYKKRIHAMEIIKLMRCCRKILRVSYTDQATNVEVHNRIQHAVGRQDLPDYSEETEAEVTNTDISSLAKTML